MMENATVRRWWRLYGAGVAEAITRDAYEKLLGELARLEGEGRRGVAEAIRYARGFGDISENPEYEVAREEQAHLESRIARLRERLELALVVDEVRLADGVVHVGSVVEVEDDEGERLRLRIATASEERDAATPGSPLGRALLGARIGDVVEVRAPRRTWLARVVDVTA